MGHCHSCSALPTSNVLLVLLQLPSRFSASYVVAGMGVLWAGMGGALLLATNQITDSTSRYTKGL